MKDLNAHDLEEATKLFVDCKIWGISKKINEKEIKKIQNLKKIINDKIAQF